MNKFIVNDQDDNKKYGLYEYFINGNNHKALGVIGRNKYAFEYPIADHYGKHQEFEEEVGEYNLSFVPSISSPTTNELNILYIVRDEEEEFNQFQYDCIFGMLIECKMYDREHNTITKINADQQLFLDGKYRHTADIEQIIADLSDTYNELFTESKEIKLIKRGNI